MASDLVSFGIFHAASGDFGTVSMARLTVEEGAEGRQDGGGGGGGGEGREEGQR